MAFKLDLNEFLAPIAESNRVPTSTEDLEASVFDRVFQIPGASGIQAPAPGPLPATTSKSLGESAVEFVAEQFTPLSLAAFAVAGPAGRGAFSVAKAILPSLGIKRLVVHGVSGIPGALEVAAKEASEAGLMRAFGSTVRIAQEKTFLGNMARGIGVALPFSAADSIEAALDEDGRTPAGAFTETMAFFVAIDTVGTGVVGPAWRGLRRLWHGRITERMLARMSPAAFGRLQVAKELGPELTFRQAAEETVKDISTGIAAARARIAKHPAAVREVEEIALKEFEAEMAAVREEGFIALGSPFPEAASSDIAALERATLLRREEQARLRAQLAGEGEGGLVRLGAEEERLFETLTEEGGITRFGGGLPQASREGRLASAKRGFVREFTETIPEKVAPGITRIEKRASVGATGAVQRSLAGTSEAAGRDIEAIIGQARGGQHVAATEGRAITERVQGQQAEDLAASFSPEIEREIQLARRRELYRVRQARLAAKHEAARKLLPDKANQAADRLTGKGSVATEEVAEAVAEATESMPFWVQKFVRTATSKATQLKAIDRSKPVQDALATAASGEARTATETALVEAAAAEPRLVAATPLKNASEAVEAVISQASRKTPAIAEAAVERGGAAVTAVERFDSVPAATGDELLDRAGELAVRLGVVDAGEFVRRLGIGRREANRLAKQLSSLDVTLKARQVLKTPQGVEGFLTQVLGSADQSLGELAELLGDDVAFSVMKAGTRAGAPQQARGIVRSLSMDEKLPKKLVDAFPSWDLLGTSVTATGKNADKQLFVGRMEYFLTKGRKVGMRMHVVELQQGSLVTVKRGTAGNLEKEGFELAGEEFRSGGVGGGKFVSAYNAGIGAMNLRRELSLESLPAELRRKEGRAGLEKLGTLVTKDILDAMSKGQGIRGEITRLGRKRTTSLSTAQMDKLAAQSSEEAERMIQLHELAKTGDTTRLLEESAKLQAHALPLPLRQAIANYEAVQARALQKVPKSQVHGIKLRAMARGSAGADLQMTRDEISNEVTIDLLESVQAVANTRGMTVRPVDIMTPWGEGATQSFKMSFAFEVKAPNGLVRTYRTSDLATLEAQLEGFERHARIFDKKTGEFQERGRLMSKRLRAGTSLSAVVQDPYIGIEFVDPRKVARRGQ